MLTYLVNIFIILIINKYDAYLKKMMKRESKGFIIYVTPLRPRLSLIAP